MDVESPSNSVDGQLQTYSPSLDPARVDLTLDFTAIAILTVSKPPRLPTYGGHLVPRPPLSMVGTTATEVVVRLQGLCQVIENLNESPIERRVIRVPLDLMRPYATTQRWRSIMLSAQKLGTFAGLLDMCGMLRTPQRHTGTTLTMLSDTKIHHVVMRFLYGSNYVTKNFHRYLKSLPQVYGIQHPYKYTLTMLYRHYFSMIACLLFPNLTTATSVLLHRPVPFMGKVVASLVL